MRFDFHSRTEGSHRQNRKLCHRTPPKIALCLDGKHKKPLAALDPVDRGNPLLHHLPNPETQALRGSFVTRAEHVWVVLVARSKLLLLAVTITAYAYSPPSATLPCEYTTRQYNAGAALQMEVPAQCFLTVRSSPFAPPTRFAGLPSRSLYCPFY